MKILRILFLFLFMGTLSSSILAQELDNAKDNANAAFANLEYAKAVGYYEKLVKNNTTSKYVENLAVCYYKTKNYPKAIEWLKKTLLIYPNRDYIRFDYADALQHMGDYEFALSQYKFIVPADQKQKELIDQRIISCKNALKISLRPASFKIWNDSLMNTSNSEFSVTQTNQGLIFSSDRIIPNDPKRRKQIFGWTNTPFINLFLSKKLSEGKYDSAKVFAQELLNNYHTSNAVFSPDQNTIYFTRTQSNTNPKKSFKEDPNVSQGFINRLEIFYSRKVGSKWSDPKPFPYNKVNEYSVAHPCLSLDGKILYFASDMPGGKGGIDLYYSKIEGDNFSSPVNLGDSINSPGNEEFPVMGMDQNLYYSSDGLEGLGGLDIFRTSGSENHWAHPINLGSPVNSSMDDFGFLPLDSNAYNGLFTSDRIGGKGSDDIYHFKRTDSANSLLDSAGMYHGKVINAESGKGISHAKLSITQTDKKVSYEYLTDSLGNYKFHRNKNKNYIIRIKKANYFTHFDTLNFDANGVLVHKSPPVALVPIVIDKPIRLENIYYDFNSWKILPQAAKILDGLVKTMKENPEIEINLDSHTDSRGDSFINKYISEKRAQAAVDYLISQGVQQARMKARGFGKERPIVRCDNGYHCTEADHQLNRRTEFSVTKVHENLIQ